MNGLTLSVGAGETVGLVGETGAGKTTTALGIMNLVPDPPGRIVSGQILYNGEDLAEKKPDRDAGYSWAADIHDIPGSDDSVKSGSDSRGPDC